MEQHFGPTDRRRLPFCVPIALGRVAGALYVNLTLVLKEAVLDANDAGQAINGGCPFASHYVAGNLPLLLGKGQRWVGFELA
jgi:hypothetical protein